MFVQLLPKLLFSGLLAAAVALPQGKNGASCCGNSRDQGSTCNCSFSDSEGVGTDKSSTTVSANQVSMSGEAFTESYGGQKVCPVTGKALGSMGRPIAVEVTGGTIYVCCNGCVAKVKANPDFYLAKVKKELEKK